MIPPDTYQNTDSNKDYECINPVSYTHLDVYKRQLTGSFFNPGPYAGYLAMVLPVCLHLYLCIPKDKTVIHYLEKGIIALTGILILCVLPATMSLSLIHI